MVTINSDKPEAPPEGNHFHTNSPAAKKIVLAHLSDPHISCVNSARKHELLNKRLLGYLRWRLFRKRGHSDAILDVLKDDLKKHHPDHIAITGDLTHLGLPVEFAEARTWLESLGTADQVTVVPGNHDAYVRSDWNQTFARWTDYMASDEPFRQCIRSNGLGDLFPTLRIRGKIALIGVCSACPSAPHLATGTLKDSQLNKLEHSLKWAAVEGLFRILIIHHPPLAGVESWRRCLTNAHELCRLVERCGVELILHGHVHQAAHHVLETASGQTAVVGATSASAVSAIKERRACYFIHTVTALTAGWDVQITQHVYCPEEHRFVPGMKQHFQLHPPYG